MPNEENIATDAELVFDAETENGDELDLPVNQREVLTRAGDPQVRALHDKKSAANWFFNRIFNGNMFGIEKRPVAWLKACC